MYYVGLSNICYTDRGKIPQYLIRSLPAKGTHGKVVVIPAVIAFQLGVEVRKRIKRVCGIKALIVFTVTSFHFAIVPGCKRFDQFVPDPVLLKMNLKKGGAVRTAVRPKTFGKFLPVVSLDTFDGEGKGSDQVFHKLRGGIGTVLLKGFHETPPGVFVNGGILVKFLPFRFVYKAYRRNKLYIDLDAFAGMGHLFIGFGNVFGISQASQPSCPACAETGINREWSGNIRAA